MTKAGDSVVSDRNNRMKNSNNRGYSNRGNSGGNHQNGYRNSQYNNGATNNGDKETNNTVSANAVLNKNLPKPSQDQLNVSKMLDIMSNIPEDKIQMLMSITACSRERASDLLHECNLDVQAAVDRHLDGSDDEWQTQERKQKAKKAPSPAEQDQNQRFNSRGRGGSAQRGDRRPSRGRGGFNAADQNNNRRDNRDNDRDNRDFERDNENGQRGGFKGRGRGRGRGRGGFNDRSDRGYKNYDREQENNEENSAEPWESQNNRGRYNNSPRGNYRGGNYRGRGRGRDENTAPRHDDRYSNRDNDYYRGSSSDRGRRNFNRSNRDYENKKPDDNNQTEIGTWSNPKQEQKQPDQDDEWKQSWGAGNWDNQEAVQKNEVRTESWNEQKWQNDEQARKGSGDDAFDKLVKAVQEPQQLPPVVLPANAEPEIELEKSQVVEEINQKQHAPPGLSSDPRQEPDHRLPKQQSPPQQPNSDNAYTFGNLPSNFYNRPPSNNPLENNRPQRNNIMNNMNAFNNNIFNVHDEDPVTSLSSNMNNMRVNNQPENNANIPTGQTGSNNSSRPTSRNAASRIPPQQTQPPVQNIPTSNSSNTHIINSQYGMMDSNRFGQQQPQGIFQMDRAKLESPNVMQKPVQTTQHQIYQTPPQQQSFGYQGWSAFQSPFAQPNNLASQFGYTNMNPPFFAQPNQQRFAQSQQIANQNQINQLFSKSQQPPQTQRQQPTTINSFPNNSYMQAGSYGQQNLAQQPAAVQQLVGGINTPYREINSQMQNGLATKPIYQ